MSPVALGLGGGMVVSPALGRLLQNLLFGVGALRSSDHLRRHSNPGFGGRPGGLHSGASCHARRSNDWFALRMSYGAAKRYQRRMRHGEPERRRLRAIEAWSHPPGSNRRPADYESAALPAELGWLG